MRKRGGLFFGIAAIIMALIIWGNPIPRIQAVFFPQVPAIVPASQSIVAANLTVDTDRLMSHVAALSQPRVAGAEKASARNYIISQLASYGLNATEQPYNHPETGAATTGGVNIAVTLPSRDPAARTLVLGGHYDTTENSPGADDNASAIATMLETARLVSSLAVSNTASQQAELLEGSSLPFPSNLQLVFFDQEERQPDGSGLLGSLAFTANNPDLSNVKGAIILDMVGYACRIEGCQRYPQGLPTHSLPTTGDFLAVLGLSTHTDLIGAFVGSAQVNWPLVVSLPIPEGALRLFPDLIRSDHAPFWEKDVPAVFVTDTANFRNANYHTPRDILETLDPSFFSGSAQHVVNAVTTLLEME